MYEQQKKEEEIKGGFTMKLVSKMRKKKNNKGFSLVELIVVVLIIAIIAVALAPQVMKWVGTAKTNVDKSNSAALKSAALTAYAEFTSAGYTLPLTPTPIPVNESIEKAVGETGYESSIRYYLNEIFNGDYPKTQKDGYFTIKITQDGKVTIEPTPIP